jgi:hypothetical protein
MEESMNYREKAAQEILVDIYTNAYDEPTLVRKLEAIMAIGWTEDQVLLMLETLALALAKENGNTAQVISLINNHWDSRKAG